MQLDPHLLINLTTTMTRLVEAAISDDLPTVRASVQPLIAWLSHLDTLAEAIEAIGFIPTLALTYPDPNGPSYDNAYDYDPDPSTTPN